MFNLYNFVFKNKIITPPAPQSTDYLRKVLIVLANSTVEDLQVKNSEIALTEAPATQGIIDAGLNSFDYISVTNSDISAISESFNKKYFSVIFLNMAVDNINNNMDTAPVTGNFLGITYYASETIPVSQIERMAISYKSGYNVCYDVASFLSLTQWNNNQYANSNSTSLFLVETQAETESKFTKCNFWGRTEQGIISFGMFAGGKPLFAYYLVEEINTKIQNKQLSYISTQKPFKSEFVRLLLQDEARGIINLYVNNGIQEDYSYELLDTGIEYEYDSKFDAKFQKPLYKINSTTIIA